MSDIETRLRLLAELNREAAEAKQKADATDDNVEAIRLLGYAQGLLRAAKIVEETEAP